MKNTLLSFGLAGITTALLSFTFVQKGNEVQEPKKSRHIKMVKIENGKKMELDTVLTNDDVFVWHGDTIGGKMGGKHFSSSGTGKMQHVNVTVDDKDGKENVMIIRHNKGKSGEPMIWNMDSGDDMEIVTEDIDSLGKQIVVRKRIKDGEGKHMMFFNDSDMKHFPPVPPVPPVAHFKSLRENQSGRLIDLNDPNIVTYKKKDLKGGLEKIEIIRKKSKDQKNMTFEYKVDKNLMPPHAPGAPEMIHEFNADGKDFKIIRKEKQTDDGKGKEIEIQVESENK